MFRWASILGLALLWPVSALGATGRTPLCTGDVDTAPVPVRIQEGERPFRALRRAQFEAQEVSRALSALGTIAYFDGVNPGTEIWVRKDRQGRLASLELRYVPGLAQCVERMASGFFRPRTIEIQPVMSTELIVGGPNEGPLEVAQLVNAIFGATSEFQYRALVETYYVGPSRVGYGKVLAATRLDASGNVATAYAFTSESGQLGYYDASGAPMLTHGFSSPVPEGILTSAFGLRRHPISMKWRTHFGTDFGAPIKTPVLSVLDGVVLEAKRDRAFGNMIMLDHGNGLVTRYAHLHRFAKGMKVGRAVPRGTLIGYLGQTGLATGPHLHLEAMIDGRPIDPLRFDLPLSSELSAHDRSRFLRETKILYAGLEPFVPLEHPRMAVNVPLGDSRAVFNR